MGLKAMDAAGEVGSQYEAKSERGTSQSVPEDRPHATCQMQYPSYSMTLLTVVLHFWRMGGKHPNMDSKVLVVEAL